MQNQPLRSPKLPQAIWNNIFAFPPNRETLGGTAYFIVENEANILIDCPAWDEVNQNYLNSVGGVRWLFLTHRGAIGKAREIQQAFGCEILIQEQEAYLLPGLKVTRFKQGRHILPNQIGELLPLRTAKTFHWFRQLTSIQLLRDRFTPETLNYICPGANTGFLRGKRARASAYEQLARLDLTALRQQKPVL